MKALFVGIAGIAILLLPACSHPQDAADISFHATFIEDFDLLRWDVGHRLLFLPVARSLAGSLEGKYPGWDAPYEEMAEKVGRVLSSKKDSNGNMSVRVQMEDSRKMFQGSGSALSLDDEVILAENYETARTHVLGKTLWVRVRKPDQYDERTKEPNLSFSIPRPGRLEGVQVTDVLLTGEKLAPVRLILSWKDRKYVQDVSVGDPGYAIANHLHRIQDLFLDVNPASFHWPDDVLTAIKERRIMIGMTADQVVLSWGEPEKKNQTLTASGAREQWVYPGNQYAYLDNGILMISVF